MHIISYDLYNSPLSYLYYIHFSDEGLETEKASADKQIDKEGMMGSDSQPTNLILTNLGK